MTDPLIGRTLKDTYRIDAMLADGGMSRVYLAEQLSLARKVVVKMLLPSFYDDDFIQLFLREARICSQLNHPNIVSVLDFGHTEDGLVFLVMEYLEGASLADIVYKEKGLSLSNITWLMEPLCSAINAAHQHNVVHRDLKPGNVMVATLSGNETTVKVVDFGISKPMHEENLKHTQLGTVMGTPGYLAPEQIRGANINHLADIYGIGAILHFMITGEAPYRGASREVIMAKQMRELPPPLTSYSLNDPACQMLQPIVNKAMALEREQRYASTVEMWQAFSQCIREAGPLLSPPTLNDDPILFNLVCQGERLKGFTADQIRAGLKKSLRFSDTQLNALLKGKRVTIKKDVNEQEAKRFIALFRHHGLIVQAEALDDRTRVVSPQSPSTSHSMPQTPGSQPISVASFVAAGTSPFAHNVPSSPQISQPSINSFTSPPRQAESSYSTSAPNQRTISRRRNRWITALCSVICIASITMYAVPSWRYGITDHVVFGIGLAQPQRGISHDRIQLGMSSAFSGSARELGRAMRTGAEAYFHQLNEGGGIHGRTLHLKSLDDGYEPEQASRNMSEFLDRDSGVFALLGNVGTPTSKAILPQLLENKMILFGAFSGAQILRNDPPDRYVFNYRASYGEETAALVHYFVSVLGIAPKNIAVFYQDDSFGRDGLTGVANAIDQYGVSLKDISTANYQRNSTRVMNAIALLRPEIHHLEGIIIVGAYPASSRFIKLMRINGYQGHFANVSFVGSEALAEELRESENNGGDGVIVSQVVPMYDAYASGVLEYQAAMKTHFPTEQPGFVSLEGYVAAKLFTMALIKAGRYFTTEELVDELEHLNNVDLGIGKPLSFSPSDHQASHQVWGSIINQQGEFEALDLEKVRLE